jgi:PAS domain-containing protein
MEISEEGTTDYENVIRFMQLHSLVEKGHNAKTYRPASQSHERKKYPRAGNGRVEVVMQTDRESALETALRTSAHLMLKHAKVAMALFDARTLCLLAANPSYDALLPIHWQHGQAIGHALSELLPPSAHHQCIGLFQKVAQTGISCSLEASAFPACTGETLYWNWILDPIVEHEQVQSVLLTITEATAQIQARQEHTDLSQTHQGLHLQQQQRDDLETVHVSVQGYSEPKAVAEALASAQLHAELADEQQRLGMLLDQLPEGIVLVEARTSKVHYANPVAAELLG